MGQIIKFGDLYNSIESMSWSGLYACVCMCTYVCLRLYLIDVHVCICVCLCFIIVTCTCVCTYICWLLSSNQVFIGKLLATRGQGVGNHRVG